MVATKFISPKSIHLGSLSRGLAIMCDYCKDLQIEFEIQTPGDLKKAIRIVRANLDDGTLEEVSINSNIGNEVLSGDGTSLPDYIEIHFHCCHCRTRFCLEAETYHGSGGSWSKEN